jgi:hypothetical protein
MANNKNTENNLEEKTNDIKNTEHEETKAMNDELETEHLEELSNGIDLNETIISENDEESDEKEPLQENNEYVKPTSSRQDVEVDKIFQLLQDAKKELKNKNTYEKSRKERIDKIINDIPQSTLEKLTSENTIENIDEENIPQDNKVKEEETTIQIKPINKEQKSSNIISYLLLIIVMILSFLLFDNTKNNNPKIDNIKLSFVDLPLDVQKGYILKEKMILIQNNTNSLVENAKLLVNKNKELEDKITILTSSIDSKINTDDEKVNKNRNLLKEIQSLKKEQEIYSNKVVSLRLLDKKQKSKIKILDETVNTLKNKTVLLENKFKEKQSKKTTTNKYDDVLKKEVFPAIKSNSKNYKIVKCYDLGAGEFYLSSKCKRDIAKFAKENKNAKRFEIIGVVDDIDFTSIYKKALTSKDATQLQKYNAMGLARYRVLETSWFLNEQIKDAVLTPVNYTITSKKNNRGSIIRAYF